MSEPRAPKRPRQDTQQPNSSLPVTDDPVPLVDDDQSPVPPSVEDAQGPTQPVTPPDAAVPQNILACTPIARKTSGIDPFAQNRAHAEERNIKLGQETMGKWVGGMDPRDFLDQFLPPVNHNTLRPAFNRSAFATVLTSTNEVGMYGLFIKAMSPYAPHLDLVDVHAKVDRRCDGIAVDIAAYDISKCDITKCDFSQMEIPIEVKPDANLDPFVDYIGIPTTTAESFYPFESDQRAEHNTIRGQIASYSCALTCSQFRLHSFSVFISGEWARLLRWDRNGVIVSKRIFYVEDDTLVEFFWRYSHAPLHDVSGLDRGHDPTVTICDFSAQTVAENDARLKLAKLNKYHQDFRIILIPDREGKDEYPFLVSFPPRHTRHSPFGRGTRPCLAFDLTKDKLVFMKDYWRPIGDHFDKEGDIYKLLEDAQVPYLAPFGRGNDIRNHVTYTERALSEPWVYPAALMVPLQHYRLSLDEVGRPLNEFESSYQLVTAIADGMEAHEVAYHDAKVLHRDISSGNILISESGRGMLIDWDLCLNMNKLKGEARRPNRTGTWQFLSVHLAKDPLRIQGVNDDRESALYVLLWHLMCFTKHNFLDQLTEEMRLFDEISDTGRGGKEKELFLLSRYILWKFPDRPLLGNLITELCRTFQTRYQITESGVYPEETGPDLASPNLTQKFWLVTTLRNYLTHRSQWPATDKAARNYPTRTANRETGIQYTKRLSEIDSRQTGPTSLKRRYPPSEGS